MGELRFLLTIQYNIKKEKILKLDLCSDLTNSCFIELDKHTINNLINIVLGCIYKPPHVSIGIFFLVPLPCMEPKRGKTFQK